MDHTLALYQGFPFLGGRSVAFKVRTEAEKLLRSSCNARIFLDFSNVEGVSHSFADELLSPLNDLVGSAVSERVGIIHCSEEVVSDLKSVAEMHSLPMPFTERAIA